MGPRQSNAFQQLLLHPVSTRTLGGRVYARENYEVSQYQIVSVQRLFSRHDDEACTTLAEYMHRSCGVSCCFTIQELRLSPLVRANSFTVRVDAVSDDEDGTQKIAGRWLSAPAACESDTIIRWSGYGSRVVFSCSNISVLRIYVDSVTPMTTNDTLDLVKFQFP